MAGQPERRAESHVDFRQRVRRYRPSDLLPALASHSADRAVRNVREPERERYSDVPWAVAAIARDSIQFGNEHRHGKVSADTVARLISAFNQSFDEPADSDPAGFLTAMAYEQLPLQESEFEEMSRVQALFLDPTLGPVAPWEDMFGMPLSDALRAAFILRGWVTFNGGLFDRSIAGLPQVREIFERAAPQEQIFSIASQLTSTVTEAKAVADAAPPLPAHLQRYTLNPLVSHPLVDLGARGIWAPLPALVDRALYPGNLYYRGIKMWEKPFADALGARVEAYVGRQLGLIATAEDLHPEVTYSEGKHKKKSIDWIWVTPQAVILVECKSARLTLGARAGDATLPEITTRYLTHAREQLDCTAALIRSRQPPFDRFPDDRPIVGLAVTSESFYLANSNMPEYGPRSRIDSMTVSLRELERWTCLGATAAVDALLATFQDVERRRWSFETVLQNAPSDKRNPILAEGWTHLDFVERQVARTPPREA